MDKFVKGKTKERRRFPRIKDNIFIFFQSIEDDFEAITNDISQGGLMFRASNPISEYTELLVEIYQPLNSNKDLFLPIPAKVQIVWFKKAEENNEYLMGAKITKINKESQKRLTNYINNRLESR